jgi:hypothetical protein
MNDLLQPGQHLDPDQLNAFLEGMLPEHERMQSLAHLADCEHCRQIVFLAQSARKAEEPMPVKAASPAWREWFRFSPLSMLGAASAALACALVITVALHLYRNSSPATTETAKVEPVQGLPPAVLREEAPPVAASAPARDMAKAAPAPSVSAPLAPKARLQTDIPAGNTANAGVPASSAPSVGALKADSTPANTSIDDNESRMPVQFRRMQPAAAPKPPASAAPLPGTSDTLAQSRMEKLPIAAGATVTSSINAVPQALPSNLPVVTTVSSNTLTLAADSAGTLFFSDHGSGHWKTIRPQWQGKVIQLALAPQAEAKDMTVASSDFQLTTETGVIWISGDGLHWRQK